MGIVAAITFLSPAMMGCHLFRSTQLKADTAVELNQLVSENRLSGQVDVWTNRVLYFDGKKTAVESKHYRKKPDKEEKKIETKAKEKDQVEKKSETKASVLNWWDALLLGSVVLLILSIGLKAWSSLPKL